MPKLFMVYLGGRATTSHIELHDVRFVVGHSIEETYPTLRQEWFGDLAGLHIDSYMEVQNVDGYKVELHDSPSSQTERLFFVNIGGYDPDNMLEQHQIGLFVADSPSEAKKRAKEALLFDIIDQHKDDLHAVDDCFSLGQTDQYYLHLEPGGMPQRLKPDWFGYNVIG